MDDAGAIVDNLPAGLAEGEGAGFAGDGRESDGESTGSDESRDSDESSSSDDGPALLNEELLSFVKRNDPGLVSVLFDGWESQDVDWEENARFIGESIHLSHLSIRKCHDEGADNFAAFCKGVGANRSFQTLYFSRFNLDGAGTAAALASLSPLFEGDNLKRIDIKRCTMHSNDWSNVDQLVSLLKNCNSVYHVEMDDSGPSRLGSRLIGALDGKANIKRIHFTSGRNQATREWGGWECTFPLGTLLQNPQCAVEEMELHLNDIDQTSVAFLMKSLTKNKSLRVLGLCGSSSLDADDWCGIAACMQKHRFFKLQQLDLSNNDLNDQALVMLGSALVASTTLELLMLQYCEMVSQEAWGAFLTTARTSELQELDVSHNIIGDASLLALADGLVTNTSLRILCLLGTGIDDEGAIALKNALLTNSTLVILDITAIHITSRSSEEYRTLLCNESSIDDTYASNHTLQFLGSSFPELGSLLLLNRNNRMGIPTREEIAAIDGSHKREVARRKIIRTHLFAGSRNDAVNLEPFLEMEFGVLAQAMSWMGRDRDGLSLLYKLLSALPSLLSHQTAGSNKRKRKA